MTQILDSISILIKGSGFKVQRFRDSEFRGPDDEINLL
jgi:predicted nucleic acid-binding Zn ribbon protein